MGKGGDTFLDVAINRRALARWAGSAREAEMTNLSTLRRRGVQAQQLRTHLDQLLYFANARLSSPKIGSNDIPRPHNADWAWRPEIWRGPLPIKGISSPPTRCKLGEDATLFHDCSTSEISLRQMRNQDESDLAAYGLRLEVFSFKGSFLSLVLDLPSEAVEGLKRSHVLRIEAIVEMESPLKIFARLNIRHGPNTEQILREFPNCDEIVNADFDLAYAGLSERRIDKAWVDLIFENPRMNQITLRDLTFNRRPRAQL